MHAKRLFKRQPSRHRTVLIQIELGGGIPRFSAAKQAKGCSYSAYRPSAPQRGPLQEHALGGIFVGEEQRCESFGEYKRVGIEIASPT